MNIRSLFYCVAVASGIASSSAQFSIRNATRNAWNAYTEQLESVECTDEEREAAKCNVAPFTGTFVCREFASILGRPVLRTVCARNIVKGLTVGFKEDTCGCCPDENGERLCPEVCPCVCGEGRVSVDVHVLGFIKFSRCVTNGWSRHSVAWGNAVTCSETCDSDTTSTEVPEVTEGSDGSD